MPGSENASEATHEGSLHLFCAEWEAVGRYRSIVVADLAPAEAEAKVDMGGGWGLEAGELGHEMIRSAQFIPLVSQGNLEPRSGHTDPSQVITMCQKGCQEVSGVVQKYGPVVLTTKDICNSFPGCACLAFVDFHFRDERSFPSRFYA